MGRHPSKEKVEAELSGKLFYFTGSKCKRGHLAPRYVSSSVCMECSKEDGSAIFKAMKKVFKGR